MRSLLRLYRTPTGKYKAWTLAYYLNGVRRREKFSTRQKAQKRAKDLFTKISNGETEAAGMTGADKASLARARELVGDRPIENVAAEYAEARGRLDKAGLDKIRLIDVADFYVIKHASIPEIYTADAIDELLAKKRAEDCSERWTQDLETRLTKFRKHFDCPLLKVTGAEIDKWLQSLRKLGIRSKKNYRTAISTLMTFAKGRGYLPADWNELQRVGFSDAPAGRIRVWSPAELAQILEAAEVHRLESRRHLAIWIAIRAFSGIRAAEMKRLHWSDIQRETNVIVLDSHITKTGVRRIIPLQLNLKEWLSRYEGATGPIVICTGLENAFIDVARAAGFEPRHNALRDSYASYRMAQTGYDKFKVAQECGNSPSRLEKSYRALRTADGTIITPAVAEAYFSIRPKIVTMERKMA